MEIHGGLSETVSAAIIGLMLLLSPQISAQSALRDNYLVSYISMTEGLPANFVDFMYRDLSRFIWIATSGGGLSRYDGNEFYTLTTHSTPALKSNFITCITEDNFHRLWITSENGLDEDGYYYMYQTDASFDNQHIGHGHFHARRSKDLINWE